MSDADAVPVIDVSGLRSERYADRAAVAARIGAARTVGFFSVVEHGVPRAQIDAVVTVARAFFALPQAEKERVALERSPFYRGYARLGYEQFDPAFPHDAKESFDIGRELAPDDPAILAARPFHGLNQWPAQPPGFRATLLAYYDALVGLLLRLNAALAIDLGVDEAFFTPSYAEPLAILRLLHYPPHPGAFDGRLHGAAPHTDYGGLTLLAQDDVGGLELQRRDGSWSAVAPHPGAFVCNIGDALMRWSNDVYVSNKHRVVNRSGRDRISVAFFGDPAGETEIAALPSCVSDARPARYPPVAYARYLQQRLAEAYPLQPSEPAPTRG